IKELVGTEKFTIDNAIIKIVDFIFEIWNNAALYAYSTKSKTKFEFIKINPKYQNFSELIYNYSKDIFNPSNFVGTFSFMVKGKNEPIIFDIIFINSIDPKGDISKEIGIVKSFFEIVSTINFLFDSYKNELRIKKEEMKNLYNKTKKLEQEIFGYHEKMIGLENRIKYSNLKEDMNKYINSISSVEDFEKRISNFVNILDSFIGYRINSIVVLFFHKIIKRFDKVIFWNIPEYLQENIRYNLREIEKSMDSYNIINFLSDFRVVYKGDEDFKLIMKFYYTNIR
ncbi:MAG: hypothetical protein N2169_08020, partial [bacterium]|nr:hypothetical protein [bacterium]